MSTISSLAASASPATSTTSTSASNPYSLSPQDFIQLMVTQLKNQDPTQPMSNEDLLQQMTNIGQLESADQLQSSLTTMTMQNDLGNAAKLIGQNVTGLDDQQQQVAGMVNSVQVQNSVVYLQLDSGATLQLGNVTSIAPGTTTATTPS